MNPSTNQQKVRIEHFYWLYAAASELAVMKAGANIPAVQDDESKVDLKVKSSCDALLSRPPTLQKPAEIILLYTIQPFEVCCDTVPPCKGAKLPSCASQFWVPCAY